MIGGQSWALLSSARVKDQIGVEPAGPAGATYGYTGVHCFHTPNPRRLMPSSSFTRLMNPLTPNWLQDLNPKSDDYAAKILDRLLKAASENGASDLHLDSLANGLIVRMRAKGALTPIANIPYGQNSQVIARIKSLAGLLTYRTDIPQEGRIGLASGADARVGTLPTLHGERLVIRFSISQSQHWKLEDLGLPADVLSRLEESLDAPSGVVLICGPAGSGKTTTAYAGLQRLSQADADLRRCLVSLEDPIEQVIDGISQSQIQPNVGYDWAAGLKAILRQDPEVMLIGEVRDAETAQVVFQAAATGQLVVSTMHARSVGDAVARLIAMEVPKHQILSSLLFLSAQRLVRSIAAASQDRDCVLLVEQLPNWNTQLREAILTDPGADEIEAAAVASGMRTLRALALDYVKSGVLDSVAIRRHFRPS